jgi:hypothetical protein
MNDKITLDDLLSAQSSVLSRIARDLEGSEERNPNMAGHTSSTTGHNSSGFHNSHSSGVSAAPNYKPSAKKDEAQPKD